MILLKTASKRQQRLSKDSSIIFKRRARKEPKPRKQKIKSPFKKGNKKQSRTLTRIRRVRNSIFSKIGIGIGIALLLASTLYGAYYAVNKVLDLREKSRNGDSSVEGMVVGIENVPEYPQAEFIFKHALEDPNVQELISGGTSAYRLPPQSSFTNVEEYYLEQLPTYSWTQVNSVPLSSPTMLPGEYWVRDSVGLRIYTRLNDIWYQIVSVEEAEEGLASVRTEQLLREEILNSEDVQKFLPDFPWILGIPNEYSLDYYSTEYEDYRGVEINETSTGKSIYLQPIGETAIEPEDTQVERFLDSYTGSENALTDGEWKVINSAYTRISGRDMLQVSLTSQGSVTTAYVLRNKHSGMSYILISFDQMDEFIQYFLENVEDMGDVVLDTDLRLY